MATEASRAPRPSNRERGKETNGERGRWRGGHRRAVRWPVWPLNGRNPFHGHRGFGIGATSPFSLGFHKKRIYSEAGNEFASCSEAAVCREGFYHPTASPLPFLLSPSPSLSLFLISLAEDYRVLEALVALRWPSSVSPLASLSLPHFPYPSLSFPSWFSLVSISVRARYGGVPTRIASRMAQDLVPSRQSLLDAIFNYLGMGRLKFS